MQTTRALVVSRFGGPDVLVIREDVEVAGPEHGQLLIQVEAAGVNFRDIYQREGELGGSPPLVAGVEGAGTVVGVGPGVEGMTIGDRVCWASSVQGSYAAHTIVDASKVVAVPPALSSEVAAALLLQGMTAHYLCDSTYAVQPDDWVLVHASAGGVGLLLTQMVVMRGGRVVGTTSSPAKAATARAHGAEVVFGYDDFEDGVRNVTGGRGVAAVYDGVGAATLPAGIRCLRPRGVLASYGWAGGMASDIDLGMLRGSSIFATLPSLATHTATREDLVRRATDVLTWTADGRLRVTIGGRYGLEEGRRAQEDLASRRTTGKLVLLP